jgi:cellulose synthase/poly-beta-1,6-N-acetylglucosamine synthase-like glycosyltransferase
MGVPSISVVIPARDASRTLGDCVRALITQDDGPDEVVVVDDGSTDGTRSIAESFGARVVQGRGRGPAAARNLGAAAATGDVVVFVDADVCLVPGFLRRVRQAFEAGQCALCGMLAPQCPERGLASAYKNGWMHYTYAAKAGRAALFYTSCSAITRDLFQRSGGFDEGYGAPGLEDTDFGQRLHAAGTTPLVDTGLLGVHHKAYRLRDVLALDFRRAVALVRLVLRRGKGLAASSRQSSVPLSHMVSVGWAGACVVVAAAAGSWFPLVAAVLGSWVLNLGFLGFLLRTGGMRPLMAALIFLPLDILAVLFGVIWGLVSFPFLARAKRY